MPLLLLRSTSNDEIWPLRTSIDSVDRSFEWSVLSACRQLIRENVSNENGLCWWRRWRACNKQLLADRDKADWRQMSYALTLVRVTHIRNEQQPNHTHTPTSVNVIIQLQTKDKRPNGAVLLHIHYTSVLETYSANRGWAIKRCAECSIHARFYPAKNVYSNGIFFFLRSNCDFCL